MIITQTPLRISFFGGGTDMPDYYRGHGGAVLSTTIDKYFFVAIKERFDDSIRAGYSTTELVDDLNDLKHELIREALKKTGIRKGVEISTMSDIPALGTGLGSSSSVTVGLLNAFYLYQGKPQTADILARNACEIEIDILKKPIGKQDQYASAYGNLNLIKFSPDGNIFVNKLEFDEKKRKLLNLNLLLFYTGIHRKSETILDEQKRNIEDRLLVLKEIEGMVEEAREILNRGFIDDFGKLLHRGWELKKKLASKITNDAIDEFYYRALDAGALGGKITGAGGGGFLLLYCPIEKQSELRKAFSRLRELPFDFEKDGTKAILNVRR